MKSKNEQSKDKLNERDIGEGAEKKDSKFLGFIKDNIPLLIVLILSLLINYGLNIVLSLPLWVIATSIGVIAFFWVLSVLVIALFKVRKDTKEIDTKLELTCSNTESKMNDITENLASKIEKCLSDLNQSTDSINYSIKKLQVDIDLLDYILDTKELTELEGSVGNCIETELNIYVQSSKFILEKSVSEFKEMICENLKKGVVYHYLIPEYDEIAKYRDFISMLYGWFVELSKFLRDKENFETNLQRLQENNNLYWDKEYLSIFMKAKDYWSNPTKHKSNINDLYSRLFIHFTNRLKVYVADKSTFYTTTAAYEVEPNKWKAIIKLPSSTSAQNYYSFNVYGDRCVSEDDGFIRMFIGTFNKQFKMLPNVWEKVIDKISKEESTKKIEISYKKGVKTNA